MKNKNIALVFAFALIASCANQESAEVEPLTTTTVADTTTTTVADTTTTTVADTTTTTVADTTTTTVADTTTTTVADTTTTTVLLNTSLLFDYSLEEGSIVPLDIVVDGKGDIYIAGNFRGTVNFGAGSVTAEAPVVPDYFSGYDAFIAKYDKNFTFKWVNYINESSIGLSSYTSISGIAVLDDSSIVVVGSSQLPKEEDEDYPKSQSFRGKLSSDGQLQDIKFIDSVNLTAVVAYDDTYFIAGSQSGCQDFGKGEVCAISPFTDILALSLESYGFHKVFGSQSSNTYARDIAVDSEGNLLITGRVRDAVEFDDQSVISSDTSDAFVLKLDKNGNVIWVKSFPNPINDRPDFFDSNFDYGNIIKLDAYDNIYVGIYFTDSNDFGGGIVGSPNSRGYSLVKLDKSGNYIWDNSYFFVDGDTPDYSQRVLIRDLYADSSGNVAVSMFNSIKNHETLPEGPFVIEYDSDGNILAITENNSVMNISGYGDTIIVTNVFGLYDFSSLK